MSTIWEMEQSSPVYDMLTRLIRRNHQHLAEAKIVLYCCDKLKLRGDHVVIAEAKKASPMLKASTNADFTVTFYMMPWGDLDSNQKEACFDHELFHCGVAYEPVKEQVGMSASGKQKWKVVKDEYGRKQYTNTIERDENGEPKWRIIPHDLEEFRDVVERYGMWDENLQQFKQAIDRAETASVTTEIVDEQ